MTTDVEKTHGTSGISTSASPHDSGEYAEKRRTSVVAGGTDFHKQEREANFLTRNGLNFESFKRREFACINATWSEAG